MLVWHWLVTKDNIADNLFTNILDEFKMLKVNTGNQNDHSINHSGFFEDKNTFAKPINNICWKRVAYHKLLAKAWK